MAVVEAVGDAQVDAVAMGPCDVQFAADYTVPPQSSPPWTLIRAYGARRRACRNLDYGERTQVDAVAVVDFEDGAAEAFGHLRQRLTASP